MTTTVNTRKLLDRKQWEAVSTSPVASAAGSCIVSSRLNRQMQYFIPSATTAWEYLPEEDAWAELPSPALVGTFGAGTAGIATPMSTGFITSPLQRGEPVLVTASAGTAASGTTIITNQNFATNGLITYIVRCITGANAGLARGIASNTATTITLSASWAGVVVINDVFSIEPITQIIAASGTAGTAIATFTSVNGTALSLIASSFIGYQIRCVQAVNSGNLGVARWITANTTTSITVVIPFPANISATDIFVIEPILTVTAGAGSTTTSLTVAGFMLNAYAGFQIRSISAMTSTTYPNVGQVRLIQSNTNIAIIPQSAFTVAPVTGDTFIIEPIIFNREKQYTGLATTGCSITSASAVAATTITVSGTPFLTNSLIGCQVKSVSGTVAANIGLIRTVISNTANVLTFAAASWTAGGTTAEVFELGIVPVNVNSTTFSTTTAGGTTTITSTVSVWAGSLAGWQVKPVTGTAGNIGLIRTVVSNTSNVLTLNAAITATTSGDTFELMPYNAPWISGQWASTALSTTATTGGPYSYQVRITGGTGGGQLRSIVNNTSNILILSSNWNTVPDATSTYVIEPTIVYSSSTSIATNQTFARDLRGFYMYVQTHQNKLEKKLIASNTQGMNSVVTFTDRLTDSPSKLDGMTYNTLAVTSAASQSVFSVSSATWATNQLVGYQIKFVFASFGTSGNVGIIRTVVSNTGTAITLSQALPTQPVANDTFELNFVQTPTISSYVVATGSPTATTIPTANTWIINQYTGSTVKCITATNAGNIGLVRAIVTNTTSDLTVSAFPYAVSATDTFEMVININASTAGTTTTIVTVNNWTVNLLTGSTVRCISSANADNIGLTRTIASNTATTLTLTQTVPVPTAANDVFELTPFYGVSYTASSGSTTVFTMSTSPLIPNKYIGYQLRVLSGTNNVGLIRPVMSNTASTITVAAFAATMAASDVVILEPTSSQLSACVYQLECTRVWIQHPASAAVGSFKYYDYAYNAWFAPTGFSSTGASASVGTDCALVTTSSTNDNTATTFISDIATSGTANTITTSTNSWATNQWTNAYQVRITGGTGAGQVRAIIANTGTTLTVAPWGRWGLANQSIFTPDSSSNYVIEGNDDNIFLIGNNAITTYKYSVNSSAWTILTPNSPRAGAAVAGCSGHWAWGSNDASHNSDQSWTNEVNTTAGRRIYSFRGTTAVLDYYDIALNTWINGITYAPATTAMVLGTKYTSVGGRYIYISLFVSATSGARIYRYDTITGNLDPFSQYLLPQGAALAGNTMFDASYVDGNTTITWIYQLLNTSQYMLRMMIV